MNSFNNSFVIALVIATFAVPTVSAADRNHGQSAPSSVRAWVGGRIIDGTGRPAIENATLLIRDGQIEAVGKRVKLPAGAERIDATGKTIIPGLICAHGH